MAAKQVIRHDGTKWCDYHQTWEDLDRFRVIRRSDGPVTTFYAPRCRAAEQSIRDQTRATDPAGQSIIGRSKTHARDLSRALGSTVSYRWVLVELHWNGLIPYMRAAIAPGGTCLNCGAHHDDPAKYQLEHAIPYLSITDHAAWHARNLWFADGCNQKKGRAHRDRAWIEQEHGTWMREREWALHAGESGWPPYEPGFGLVPELVRADTPVDEYGTPTLFDL